MCLFIFEWKLPESWFRRKNDRISIRITSNARRFRTSELPEIKCRPLAIAFTMSHIPAAAQTRLRNICITNHYHASHSDNTYITINDAVSLIIMLIVSLLNDSFRSLKC